jgi:hypothetical protein
MLNQMDECPRDIIARELGQAEPGSDSSLLHSDRIDGQT